MLCFFVTSFETAAFIAITSFLCAKINDPGGRWCNTVQTLIQWWRSVASNVDKDIFHWVMCTVLYQQIAMTIKAARERGVFFCHHLFVAVHKCNKKTMLWSKKYLTNLHHCY
jgi:hypothetical protein